MSNLKNMLPDGMELGKVFTGHANSFVNEVRLPAADWINYRLVQMLLKTGDLKKYKSVLQKAREYRWKESKTGIDMIFKKVVVPLQKGYKIDPTKVKDLRKDIAKYGEDKFMDAWNKVYKVGVSGSYLYALAGTIFQGMERYDYVSKPLGLKEGTVNEDILTEDVWKSFLGDDPSFKLYTATNTEKRKTIQARKTNKTWDDGVPVLKYIARDSKKDHPLPKGKFKIIEDNKHGWWYYNIGSTWYGIQQKDYGTPPFEY